MMKKLYAGVAFVALAALTGATFLQGSQTPGVLSQGGTGAIPIIQSDGSVLTLAPASAATSPSNPSAITPGTGTAQMLGMGTGTGKAVLTPVFSGRVYYSFSQTVLVGSTTNGATFQCSHGTGTAPANAAAPAGTQDGTAIAYLAGATTEKAVVTCSGVVTGAAVGTALWFDEAVLNTTGSQAVTVTVPSFTAFEF